VATAPLEHSYPHCWRCKKPLLFRATKQWFIAMDEPDLRKAALAEVPNVAWVPPWGRSRITGMLEARPDWCLSRQRAWGVPIPALLCGACGEAYFADDFLARVKQEVSFNGIEWYWNATVEDLAEARFARSAAPILGRNPPTSSTFGSSPAQAIWACC